MNVGLARGIPPSFKISGLVQCGRRLLSAQPYRRRERWCATEIHPISAARCGRREGRLCAARRAYSVTCNLGVYRRFLVLGSGDKFEPAIYAANIENCGNCCVSVYLDRQYGAFHGTNPD
jgi:hypothetical protein